MGCGNGTFVKDSFCYDGIHRGVVVNTADPDQTGRIKVRVYGIFEDDIPVADLPWAVPAQPLFVGSGFDYGYFAVPEVDSQVFVFFEGKDVYQPVYFAEAPTKLHGQPTERTTNYPYRKVWKTKNGIVIFVDDTAKTVRLTHPTGKYIQMDEDGNIDISAGDVTITGGTITIQGTVIEMNP